MKWIVMGAKKVQEYFGKNRKLLQQRMQRQQQKLEKQPKPQAKATQQSKSGQSKEQQKIDRLYPETKAAVKEAGKKLNPHVMEASEVKKTPTKAIKTPTKEETSGYQPSRDYQKGQYQQKQQGKGMSL